MRILHTADWHLGRIFHQVHLTDDQALALAGFLAVVEAERPDAVIIAGDLYDRAVPPPEAVALLDRTLARLVSELHTPVVLIPGNHDSAARLGFGSSLLRMAGLHVVASLADSLEPISLAGADGTEIEIFALPFLEPAEVRQFLGDETVHDQASALAALIGRVQARRRKDRPTLLVAHAFVQGGTVSESERPLSIGGTESVPAELFSCFDYVALGHLHRPQQVGDGPVHYSGSLLKYSFSEVADIKTVKLVEFDRTGLRAVTTRPLPTGRDLRRLEGTLAEVLQRGPTDPQRDDYLCIRLLDDGPVLNAMSRLREIHPNTLVLERVFLERATETISGVDRRKLGDVEMLEAFLQQTLGRAPHDHEAALFREVLAELNAPSAR